MSRLDRSKQRTKWAHRCRKQRDAVAGHPASFLGGSEGNLAAQQLVAAAVVVADPRFAARMVAAAAEVLAERQPRGFAGVQQAAPAHPDSVLETAKPRMLAAKPVCCAAAAAPAGQLQPALATRQSHVGPASAGPGTALAADHRTAPKPRCWGS